MVGHPDGRNSVPIQVAKALRHSQNRLVLREQRVVLTQRSLCDQNGLRKVARIGDDDLRSRGRCNKSQQRGYNDCGLHGFPHRMLASTGCVIRALESKAGSSRSLVRYTFMRWPSRIVTVGSRFRNRFMVWLADWAVASPTLPVITTVRSPLPRFNPSEPRY